MTDREMWDDAVKVVRREYGELGDAVRSALAGMSAALRHEKRSLHALTADRGAEGLCAACMGACCRSGKYHFSVADLLVFLASGEEVFEPSFQAGSCPYLGMDGCLMEPSLRPFPCISFCCEEIHAGIPSKDLERLSVLENGVRGCYRRIEDLFDKPLMKSLFISYEGYLRDPVRGIISA